MIEKILFLIKKFIPEKLFNFLRPYYHFLLAALAAFYYGHPSEKMIIIGITGTTGKTTSVFLINSVLRAAGLKVGYITTAMFSDGDKDWLNDKKMTMVGRFFTQKLLRKMADKQCDVAIVETTSEGIVQFRHRFINYDILIFTGLYPEHIESHGGFENYKKEKLKLFKHLERSRKKNFPNSKFQIPNSKIIIANGNDKYCQEFINFNVDRKMIFATSSSHQVQNSSKILNTKYQILNTNNFGVQFLFNKLEIQLKLLGDFSATNATIAGCVAKSIGLSDEEIKKGLENIKNIPGRLEKIKNNLDATIIVDYAFEPKALKKLYETVYKIKHNKIIHVLGSTGGGRDKARRPNLGKIASQKADYIIVTNEDPYDEDPMKIINEVVAGIENKQENQSFWKILDRREAIKKALELARENDIVLITGKGSEQAICVADGEKIFWDDREVVKEELTKQFDKQKC